MRCELEQMERMAVEERYGAEAGEIARRMEDIRRRMRRVRNKEDENEYLGDRRENPRDC